MDNKKASKVNAIFRDGQMYHQMGNFNKALKYYDLALKHDPKCGVVRVMRAVILYHNGKALEALDESRRGVKDMSVPTPMALINHGVICKLNGYVEEAECAYKKALDIAPNNLDAKANLASLHLMSGNYGKAEQELLELTKLSENPANFINLARLYLARGNEDKAREYLGKAEELDPKHVDIFNIRAHMENAAHDDESAFDNAVKALNINFAQTEVWAILNSLDKQSLKKDVLERLLVKLGESNFQIPTIIGSAITLCRQNLIWKPLAALESQLSRLLAVPQTNALSIGEVFNLLGCHVPQLAHKNAAEATWKKLYGRIEGDEKAIPQLENGVKLKVGFLSSDLRDHAIGFLIAGVFEKLPHDRIEWFVYSNTFQETSNVRKKVREGVDHFVNIRKLTGAELAERMRKDGIDILVDLNGMTRDTRAGDMARKLAPIQIEWLGMPGTLGAPGIVEYMIGDKWTMPTWLASGFSEKIIQLPRSYQPNDHQPPDLSLAGTRAEHNLPDDAAVFCCFNQYYKFSPDTFAMWTEILKQVPKSVLWILQPGTEFIRERLYAMLEEAGLGKDRIVFAPFMKQARHIARISHADLVLDTLPYNAHTTCSDALRAGVPVLTLPGATFAGRVAAGILDTAGLNDWIVDSEEDYVKKAVEFASLPKSGRDSIRSKVHTTYLQSPMQDNVAFGKLLEDLFIGLAQRAADGLEPEALRLTEDGCLVPLEETECPAKFRDFVEGRCDPEDEAAGGGAGKAFQDESGPENAETAHKESTPEDADLKNSAKTPVNEKRAGAPGVQEKAPEPDKIAAVPDDEIAGGAKSGERPGPGPAPQILGFNYIADSIERVMKYLGGELCFKWLPQRENIEKTLELFADEASKRLYCNEMTYCMLSGALSGDLPSRLAGLMGNAQWQALLQEVKKKNVCPELEAPENNWMAEYCKATTFLLEQYRYEDKVEIEPGDVCLDIGACLGDTSIWLMNNGAEESYAFEIDRANIGFMRRTLAKNPQWAKIRIVEKAVSNKPGSCFYEPFPNNIGAGHIKAENPGTPGSYEVECVTIDDFCEQNGIKPDFIKMDIEGAEPLAIAGAAKTFQKHRPKFAICVYHAFDHRWSIPQMMRKLCPDYDFYLKKSHPAWETVLLGSPKERGKN